MKEYVVFDTNILVSYLLTSNENSPIRRVVRKIFEGSIIPVYRDAILSEYRDVLCRAKFHFPVVQVLTLLNSIQYNGLHVMPEAQDMNVLDPDDQCFYDTAKTAKAQWLITENKKHFPDESFIVTAAEYLASQK